MSTYARRLLRRAVTKMAALFVITSSLGIFAGVHSFAQSGRGLLIHQSNNAKAQSIPPATRSQTNATAGTVNSSKPDGVPSGLSLVIRCTNEVLKVGDEIPIQFIISNQGTEDYKYQETLYDRSGQLARYHLSAKTTSGESVPELRVGWLGRGPGTLGVLHPGESFSRFVPLNRCALINEPGSYEVVGTYPGNAFNPGSSTRPQVRSDPISITVFPRTKEEMEDYIHGLTNQVAARLVIPADKRDWTPGLPDPDLEGLLLKLAYTCRPEIVPTLIRTTYEAGPGTGDFGYYEREALLYYVPRTEEIRQTIIATIAKHGSIGNMEYLLQDYGFHHEELKAIIERALASDDAGDWQAAARLATYTNYDEVFTARLTAIASSSNSARGDAIYALALNRTDEGVKTLKTLLNDSDPTTWEPVALAILTAYKTDRDTFWGRTCTGTRLRAEDFNAKDVRPLIERMLASPKRIDGILGVNLAEMFGDESSTAKLVALATNPGCFYRDHAIYALALNRTDEGVKTLKTLLHDPNPGISGMTEHAIRYSYTSHGDYRRLLKRHLPYTSRADARGRPLRADDFDAKFREPEVTPAK